MKTKFFYIRKAVKELIKARNTEDINEVTKAVNEIVKIHKEVLNLTNKMYESKLWNALQGPANYESLPGTIEKAYYEAKDKYHNLHWEKYGFNVY